MVISRTCSVVGCDEYARITRKYAAVQKEVIGEDVKEKKQILNIDLCYRHRFVDLENTELLGSHERTPGNITKKEDTEQETNGPISKIKVDYNGSAQVVNG